MVIEESKEVGKRSVRLFSTLTRLKSTNLHSDSSIDAKLNDIAKIFGLTS